MFVTEWAPVRMMSLDKIPCKGKEFMHTLQNQHLVVIKIWYMDAKQELPKSKILKTFFLCVCSIFKTSKLVGLEIKHSYINS